MTSCNNRDRGLWVRGMLPHRAACCKPPPKGMYRCRPYRVDIWRNHRHGHLFDICLKLQVIFRKRAIDICAIDIDISSTFADLSIDIDIFWSQSLIFCTSSRRNAWKMSFFVGVCVCVYIYISSYDSAFFQHMSLFLLGFSPVTNRYIFDISIDISWEPCRYPTLTFADICAPPYPPLSACAHTHNRKHKHTRTHRHIHTLSLSFSLHLSPFLSSLGVSFANMRCSWFTK